MSRPPLVGEFEMRTGEHNYSTNYYKNTYVSSVYLISVTLALSPAARREGLRPTKRQKLFA